MIESFATWLNEQFGLDISVDPEKLAEDLGGSLQQIGGGLAGGVFAFLGSVGNCSLFTTTTALFAVFMLAALPPKPRTVLSLLPQQRQQRALDIGDGAR